MRALFLGSAVSLFSATFALAADLGQYRPGNPYQSVIAPGADVCESHCAGDAQCRSWNYIKANPQAAGVCEFNSNDVAPVASAISISGTNAASSYRSGVIAGGTNTIRVGTQTASKPRAVTQQTSSNRRIVREPAPQRRQAQTASTRPVIRPTQPGSLTTQQNQYRQPTIVQRQTPQPMAQPSQAAIPQQFQYDLGGQAIRAPQAPQRAVPPQTASYPNQAYAPQLQQIQRPQMQGQPQGQPQRQPMTSRDRRRQQGPSMQQRQQRQQMQQMPHASMAAPRQQAYAPQQQQMMRRSATQPVTQAHARPTYPAQQSPAALARGLSADQAEQSLFGKLNDDVIVPNSAATVPSDPNAPIPTSASRPVTPVQQSPLEGLAGAPQP